MNVMPNYLSPTPHPLSPVPFQRGETSIISSRNATREAAPDVVAEPSDDMMLSPSTIEGIDLNAEIPCEAGRKPNIHGVAADFLITAICPGCGEFKGSGSLPRIYGLCKRHWANGLRKSETCGSCGHRDRASGGFYQIVEVLR